MNIYSEVHFLNCIWNVFYLCVSFRDTNQTLISHCFSWVYYFLSSYCFPFYFLILSLSYPWMCFSRAFAPFCHFQYGLFLKCVYFILPFFIFWALTIIIHFFFWVRHFRFHIISELMQCLSFCVWLTSLSIMSSRFVYVVIKARIFSILKAE